MRKILAILVILLALVGVFGEVIAPHLVEGVLRQELVKYAKTDDVQVSLDATPRALVSLGRAGTLHAVAHDGMIGEMQVSELTLDGEGIAIDLPALLSDGRIMLQSADKVALRGIVTEDNLRAFLSGKVEQLENLEVHMTPEEIRATANARIMGRMADVELTGVILAEDGELFFHMNRLNIRNALLRRISMENYFGDVQITKPGTLPQGLRFTDVKMQDGKALVTAEMPAR